MLAATLGKLAVELVVSAGTGAVVTNAIKATTPEALKLSQKILVPIGSVVVSSMVGSIASKYASKTIDEAAAQIRQTKQDIDTALENV